ncbi:hypothetical protein SAMN04488581_2587 [Mycolicibacterium neoaurum]|nr:hypothetical protein SAMN04488581_2587 [Mycolicibacterium neoaurum]
MVLTRIRDFISRAITIRGRFLTILDSEGVALFQTIVYVHLAVGGLYCAVIAGGLPPALEQVLGAHFNTIWLTLCMAVTICVVGKVMSMSVVERFWVRTTGLYLQFVGDVAAAGAFYGYVFSTIQESYWGKAVVAAWVLAALGDCAALLAWRDVRRIRQEEKRIRRIERRRL